MKISTTNFRDFINGKLANNKATSTNKDGTVTQYGVTNAELLYNGTQHIDTATKAALYQYFASRIINTEEQEDVVSDFNDMGIPSSYFRNVDYGKFIRFFNTELLNDEYRYKELLRIELTQFDPMVADYLESWNKDVHNGRSSQDTNESETPSVVNETVTKSISGNKSTEDNGSKTTQYDSQTKVDVTTENSGRVTGEQNTTVANTTEDKTLSDSVDTTEYDNFRETETSKQASMSKNLPNSIMYNGATAGQLPSLNWQTGSGQNQAENTATRTTDGTYTNTHSHDNQVETNGTTTENHSATNSGSQHTEGTAAKKEGSDSIIDSNMRVENNSGTESTSVERTATSSSNMGTSLSTDHSEDEHKEVHTGRSGVLPQEALPKAINYIKNSRSFDWLKEQLDSCFLQIL